MESNNPNEIFFNPDIYESQFAYSAQWNDIPFWIQLAKTYGPKVLELACGSGRVTIPVAESGVDIEGIDYSEGFLTLAQERTQSRSLSIKFHLADLRALPFQNKYDLMYLPTGTISHLITRSEVEAFLSGAARGLRSNGVLALDVHNPTKTWLKSWPLNPGPEHSSFLHRKTNEMILLETTYAYSADTQIFTVSYHYTFQDKSSKDGTLVFKLYFPVELQSLLHYNGFEVSKIFGDYTQTEFNSENTKFVIIARKRS